MVLVLVYLGVRYGIPWLSVALGASQTPAPVPAFARTIYMMCTVVGAFVYLSSDDERWKRFLAPIVGIFLFRPGGARRHQIAVLAILPLLAGWGAWRRVVPRPQARAAIRLPHPAMPEAYTEFVNPFRELRDEQRRAVEREGTVLFQKNCRPCHGTTADGNGPLARGLRLQPVDFTDPGTIASVVEPYALWRVHTGGLGLPPIGTPWNSAMPSWQDELGDEDIWKIIMAAYRIAGTEPRRPEGTE